MAMVSKVLLWEGKYKHNRVASFYLSIITVFIYSIEVHHGGRELARLC